VLRRVASEWSANPLAETIASSAKPEPTQIGGIGRGIGEARVAPHLEEAREIIAASPPAGDVDAAAGSADRGFKTAMNRIGPAWDGFYEARVLRVVVANHPASLMAPFNTESPTKRWPQT
jgi:hypothetical protein